MIILSMLAALAAPGATPEAVPPAGKTEEAVAAPAVPAHVEPARATANLASYISDADYPPDAIRGEQQGTVRFRLSVTAEGSVERCEVLESSGSDSLDAATCRIMTTRPRFVPARDAEGHPVPDVVENRIRWVLPEDDVRIPKLRARSLAPFASYVRAADYPKEARLAREQGLAIFILVVDPAGKVLDCAVPPRTIAQSLAAATCRIMIERAKFVPARDDKGEKVLDLVPGAINWTLPARKRKK